MPALSLLESNGADASTPVSQDARTAKGEKATAGDEHQIVMPTEISPEASQRIQQEILARQTWPSYQEMLVSLFRLPFPSTH